MIKPIPLTVRAALTAVLMLVSAQTLAQSSSLQQIIEQALATNPAIQARRSFASAAQSDLEAASWQRFATPSFEANSDNNGVLTTLLRVQQPLWAGGRIDAGIDAASSRQQAADVTILEVRQDVISRIVAAYVEAVRQQANEETLVTGVKLHEELLAMIRRRVEQDASPPVDQELAQSRLYEANNELSGARQSLTTALSQLSQLAGMPVRSVVALGDDSRFALPSKAALLEQTLAHSPTLRRLGFEVATAQADLQVKRASYKPQISLRFENAHSSAALNGLSAYSSSRVLLVLEAQTGAGLSALAGVDAALARHTAAQQQREAAVLEVQDRFSADSNELQFARTRLENAQHASQALNAIYESYARQYTAGRKSWFDLLNAVREATQSATVATNIRAQAAAAALRLKLLSGNLEGLSE